MDEGSRVEVCAFSCTGEQLAIASLDGEVKVWDTASEKLRQRFLPGGQAAGAVKCLAWARLPKAKRKRQSSTPRHAHLAVAIDDSVIVWNVTKGEKESLLTSSHSNTVNSVSWGSGNKRLYSGSSDQHVVEWDVLTQQANTKWKADKRCVTCVCCHDNDELLLSAGRGIKLWSLNDHTLLKKFTGHSTSVRGLQFVSSDGDTFLSVADGDRIINLWSTSGKSQSAVATLSCEEEVISCDVRVRDELVQFAECAVLSSEGVLHLFRVPLSDTSAQPLLAFSSVQYAGKAIQQESTAIPLPILSANLSTSLHVAHSSSLQPHFETLDFDQSERRVCLVRDFTPGSLLMSQQKSKGGKVINPKVTILGPGNMKIPLQGLANQKAESIPMSERLDIPISKTKLSKQHGQPSSESLTQLLSQAVASGDGKLLEEVLRANKETIVTKTIRRLPVAMVLPFLRKLLELLQLRPARGLDLSLWIRTILTTHTAYLMTVPQLVDTLSGLYQLLDARVATFGRLSRLQGKLDLMLMQAAALGDADNHGVTTTLLNTPLLTVTVGEDSVSHTIDPTTSSDDESWSSNSSLAEDSDQSDQGSDISMETETSNTLHIR